MVFFFYKFSIILSKQLSFLYVRCALFPILKQSPYLYEFSLRIEDARVG